MSLGQQSAGQHVLARASQWPLEKPSQAAVELNLRRSLAPSHHCSTLLLSAAGLLGSPAGQVPAQALGHIQQLATCNHAKSCSGAKLEGLAGARVATRASWMLADSEEGKAA